MDYVASLFDFIKNSPTAYHSVNTAAEILLKAGYTELFENEGTELLDDGKYFVRRNGSSLIAFRHRINSPGFMICASHSDSPAFKIKGDTQSGVYAKLDVEKYGGMVCYSWLDRPLSVAGRAALKTKTGVEMRLVNFDRDLLVIPSLAIHMNRGVNDGFKVNPAQDMLPLLSSEKIDFAELLASEIGVRKEKIIAHDLFLYNRDEGRTLGANSDLMLCPRLDDLECVFASLHAFLSADENASVPVLAIFDNEEVGSETKQGAASSFLADVLQQISGAAGTYRRMLSQSFMISADNAHAKHPNHPELADPNNAPVLNGGVVLKYNASQRYTTDAYSAGIFKILAERAGVKLQSYANRADMPGGSTLGSISDTKVSLPTVDIGLAQLAMHCANETAGVRDLEMMISVLREFYSSKLSVSRGKTNIVKS